MVAVSNKDINAHHFFLQGLVQIEILKTIEQMTGKSISELFDWVVGTSTGGILALGMIYGETVVDPMFPMLL